jgi:AcrR family transcriptional regulator
MSQADERAEIIRAAWKVLDRAGFEGFKVQLVTREAGMSARSFYRHFAGKDALLLALLRDEMARAAARLRAAGAKADTPADRVALWIRNIITAADDPRRAARARLFSSLPQVMREYPVEVDEGTALLMEPLRDAIADGTAEGLFNSVDPERDAEMIYRLAGSVMSYALAERPERDVDEIVSSTTGFALRALTSPNR